MKAALAAAPQSVLTGSTLRPTVKNMAAPTTWLQHAHVGWSTERMAAARITVVALKYRLATRFEGRMAAVRA
jgi:hypothetical protein